MTPNSPAPLTFAAKLYQLYDRFMCACNFPSFYCSQCEKRIRHWVYRFDGLVHCQGCADEHVANLEASMGRF